MKLKVWRSWRGSIFVRSFGSSKSQLQPFFYFIKLKLNWKFISSRSKKSSNKCDSRGSKKERYGNPNDHPLMHFFKEEGVTHTVKEEKEEKEFCPSAGVSAGGSTFTFTPRNFQTEANLPSFQPPPHAPVFTPYLFASPFFPFSQPPQFALVPAANWVVCGACQMMGTVIPFC